ncbi:MAG: hypothetical protein Q8N42_01665 [bacterium]|nr:hypothetical protein [bacterium]
MKDILSVIAGILCIIGSIPYVYAILRGKGKPTKATWFVWASLDIITLAGMFAKYSVNGQILGSAISSFVIAILSLKYGKPGWSKTDKFCLIGAGFGIGLWQIFSNPVLGIVISLGAMFIGSFPTFTSAWKDPSREDKQAWTIFLVACVCSIIAIPQWTLAHAAQPLVFFAITAIMMYILYIHERKISI